MTTGIRWLESLPLPERDNFGDTFEEVRRRSPMEIGPVRQRRMRRASPRLFNVTFRLNQQQYTEYDLWFQNDIQGGALPFDIQLLDDDQAYVWYTCYWISPPTTAVIGSNADMWSVVGVLRARDQSFATRLPGTNELRGSAFVGVDGSAEIFVETALYGLATVGINNANGRLPNAHMYGLAQVGISNFGIFLREYFQGAAHIGVTASARLTVISDLLFGKGNIGITLTGNLLTPKNMRGVTNLSITNTGVLNVITSDPHFSQVVLLFHGDGTNGSTSIIDSSSHSRTVTLTGSPAISSANSPMGTGSIHFPSGATSNIHCAASTDWAFGTSPFTIEARVYPIAHSNFNIIAASWDSAGGTSWILVMNSGGQIGFWFNNGNFTNLGGTVPLNAWSSIAISRIGDDIWTYLNGTVVFHAIGVLATNFTSSTNGFSVGSDSSGTTNTAEMYVEELRITKGTGRLTGSTYVPSTTPFPDA